MASGMSRTIQLLVGNMAEITTIDAYVEPDDDIETQMSQFLNRLAKKNFCIHGHTRGKCESEALEVQ